MDEIEARRILWENVSLLMKQEFGGENLAKVAKAAGFKSGANMTRIKAQDTDLSLKTLAGLSRAFKLPIWQLLTPSLGAHLHVIKGSQVVPLFDLSAFPSVNHSTVTPIGETGSSGNTLRKTIQQKRPPVVHKRKEK